MLLFFTSLELEPGSPDNAMWAGDCSTVIHAPAGTTLTRTKVPGSVYRRIKPVNLRYALRADVPDVYVTASSDHLLPPLQDIEPPGGWEKWFNFRERLLGKPYVETKLLGYSEVPNGGNRCSERAEQPKGTWRHLFTMGSDDEFGFVAADGGRLQLLISPADLKAGRFDRVCGVFDSD